MPTGRLKNLLYRAALPLAVPSPAGHMRTETAGHPVQTLRDYERLLIRHRVMGSSLALRKGEEEARADVSTELGGIRHLCREDLLYRAASVTKMATALVALKLCENGLLDLDAPAAELLPEAKDEPRLRGVTLRGLLSHASGLRDVPAYEAALAKGGTWHEVLAAQPGAPAGSFAYCNFGFGLLGCVIEAVTDRPVGAVFDELLFRPLGMRAVLDASALRDEDVMEIVRVLERRRKPGVTVTPLGRQPLAQADPLRHFGHTAGAMYADAPSLLKLLKAVSGETPYLPEALRAEMTGEQARYGSIAPDMAYGLGLVIYADRTLPGMRILGHQGLAYGCVDGAFFAEGTGMAFAHLNGGASEARQGRICLLNRGLIRWAFGKELPSWT